ncbi:MAG: glycerophosphoryl diester phosphodiesterase membrane domain-containing protein [Caldilineaceae bacterium]
MQHPLIATQPLTIGDILDRSARLLRARFTEFILIPLLFLVPLAVLQSLAIMTAKPVPVTTPTLDPNNPLTPIFERFIRVSNASAGASSWLWWINLLNSFLILALPLVIIYQSTQVLQGLSPTVGQSISGGLRHMGRYLLTTILLGILMLVAALVLVGIPALCIGPFGILLFIPALFFCMARLAVATVVLVSEKAGVIQALQRSWKLTEGMFWRTFGFTLIVGILGWVIMFLPAIVTSVVILSVPPGTEKWLAILNGVSSNLIRVVILPFSNLAIVMYYVDLLVRKEGYDLALQLQETERRL